jgi:hypothetical protein
MGASAPPAAVGRDGTILAIAAISAPCGNVIVRAEPLPRRSKPVGLRCSRASRSSAMEETGLAGLRNLPPSPGRTGSGLGPGLFPPCGILWTMSSKELGPAAGPTALRRAPDRGLSDDGVGSIRLVEHPAPAAG